MKKIAFLLAAAALVSLGFITAKRSESTGVAHSAEQSQSAQIGSTVINQSQF